MTCFVINFTFLNLRLKHCSCSTHISMEFVVFINIQVLRGHFSISFFSANDIEMIFARKYVYLTKFKRCFGRVLYHFRIFKFKNAKIIFLKKISEMEVQVITNLSSRLEKRPNT